MTGVVSIQEAPTVGLEKLIAENTFFVPTHQRDYRWSREKVAQLFDDVNDSMERGDKLYFIGVIVFMQSEDGSLRLLDGQQRLATTIIILAAIRSWFGSNRPPQDDTAENKSTAIHWKRRLRRCNSYAKASIEL